MCHPFFIISAGAYAGSLGLAAADDSDQADEVDENDGAAWSICPDRMVMSPWRGAHNGGGMNAIMEESLWEKNTHTQPPS